MDYSSARQWLDELEGDEMKLLGGRQRIRTRIPDGFRPDSAEQTRRGLRGVLAQLREKSPPPTLPQIKAPTLAEIEAKYGK